MVFNKEEEKSLKEMIYWWRGGINMEKEMPSCLTCGRPYDEPQGVCQDCGMDAENWARSLTDPGLIVELCDYCADIFVNKYESWEIIEHE